MTFFGTGQEWDGHETRRKHIWTDNIFLRNTILDCFMGALGFFREAFCEYFSTMTYECIYGHKTVIAENFLVLA